MIVRRLVELILTSRTSSPSSDDVDSGPAWSTGERRRPRRCSDVVPGGFSSSTHLRPSPPSRATSRDPNNLEPARWLDVAVPASTQWRPGFPIGPEVYFYPGIRKRTRTWVYFRLQTHRKEMWRHFRLTEAQCHAVWQTWTYCTGSPWLVVFFCCTKCKTVSNSNSLPWVFSRVAMSMVYYLRARS